MSTRYVIPCALLSLLVVACPKDQGDTDGDPSTGAGSAGTTGSSVSTTSQPVTGTAGPGTTGTTGPGSTSEPDTGGTTGPGSTGEPDTGGTTGGPAGPYGPCADSEDCAPDLHCVQIYNYCSPNCAATPDCPVPATGDVVPSCADSSRGTFCRLPCPGSTMCPDAMSCVVQQPGPPANCGYP